MRNNILPLIIIVSSVGLFFKDNITSYLNRNSVNTIDEVTISEDWKNKVSNIVDIVKKSEAKQDVKNKASELWMASGDMWSLSDANFNSNQLVDFNQDLLKIYGKQYPDIAGSFPGFGEEINKLMSNVIGEYPIPMTEEKLKQLSELCYAISWAFKQ